MEDNEEDADLGGRSIPVQSAELFDVLDKVSTISPGGEQFRFTVYNEEYALVVIGGPIV